VIECGSLEYAQARLQARHGQRVDEAGWRRLETMRELAPMLELARGTALRPWLVGIAAESTAHRVEATLRGHWRALVDEVVAWMPGPWRASLAWCAVLPDLAPLQHLARGGEAAAWIADDGELAALCTAPPPTRLTLLSGGSIAALAAAWDAPDTMGRAWRAEWQRRLPQPLDEAGDSMGQLVHTLHEHANAFAEAAAGQGWQLRCALRARLSLLLRRAALEPTTAFVHVALCALDLERLRGELLRRMLFRHWRLA
jgi:hypothetical protein